MTKSRGQSVIPAPFCTIHRLTRMALLTRLPEHVVEIEERHAAAKKRVAEAQAENQRSPAGTPQREKTEAQLQLATLAAQNIEIEISLGRIEREHAQQEETKRVRMDLLQEIWTAAATLGKKRGYRMVVPDNLRAGTPYPSVVIFGSADDLDDLTNPLLTRLNEEYAQRKSK
jgi:hypothetical protein